MSATRSQQRRLAWLLLKQKSRMVVPTIRAHHRDVVGTLLADVVGAARLTAYIVIGRGPKSTELERRAVVCARRRLEARIERS